MPVPRSILPSLTALAIAILLLESCAVIPASLRQKGIDHSLARKPLGELLQRALATGDSAEADHALAYFVSEWFERRDGAQSGDITDGTRRYRVRFVAEEQRCYLPSYFDRVEPATDYAVRKIEHHKRAGVGAPLIALRENTGREPIEQYYPEEAITRPVTAVATPSPVSEGYQEVTIRLHCPLHHDEVVVGETTRPLAADFSAPWAALLQRSGKLARAEIGDFLTDKPTRHPQLYLMEPYDPDKEPLIMIHGLLDTPLVWAKLSNDLWGLDEIRQRYQIWHFLYNTSAPALYSARILRTQLRELRKVLDPEQDDPAMQSTTLLTHSMGGILGRTLISRPGQAFWDAAFTRPLDSLALTPADRASLKEAFFWEPERHVSRVIFMAVPHRGTSYANNPIGLLGRYLVGPPSPFRSFYQRISQANPGAFTPAYAELGSGKLDSVGELSPSRPTLGILAQLPLSHPVAIHSIIGNRGWWGPVEKSSDGYVPYWSSHISYAHSEKIVPKGHSVYKHKKTVEEIVRILRLPRGSTSLHSAPTP